MQTKKRRVENNGFEPAIRMTRYARVLVSGLPKSGKTHLSLMMATKMMEEQGNKPVIGLIDTENGRSSYYAKKEGFPDFVVDTIGRGAVRASGLLSPYQNYHPKNLISAIYAGCAYGCDVLIIDTLSHFWNGDGGILSIVNEATKNYGGNSYYAWGDATPLHDALISTILSAPVHIICTVREKESLREETINGRKVYVSDGHKMVQRAGLEYEFDLHVQMSRQNHIPTIKNSIIDVLPNGKVEEDGGSIGNKLISSLKGVSPAHDDFLQLAYGDGTMVSMTTRAEVDSFNEYQAEEGERPESKESLRKWYSSSGE